MGRGSYTKSYTPFPTQQTWTFFLNYKKTNKININKNKKPKKRDSPLEKWTLAIID